MAPKRRKISVDDSDLHERDGKKAKVGSIDASTVGEKDAPDSTYADKDVKSSGVKSTQEQLSDDKVKDEAPKPVRISERLIIKRNRQDVDEEPPVQIQTPPKNLKKTVKLVKSVKLVKPVKEPKKNKKRRPWALWSIRDKKLFFLGLSEHGKNFEAISNRISHATRIPGQQPKDKMLVRYFYYRCWAKISKFIDVNVKGVKTSTQELYGLINYGVLKQYMKDTDPAFGKCLNELILHGETICPKKGKRRGLRIRTPLCTCLKKLNNIEESAVREDDTAAKFPSHIVVELTPKNYHAWAKVQGLSQNPRVRFKMTANRTLESMFKFLEKKWKPPRLKLKEGMGGADDRNQELVCTLHPKCKIAPVTVIPQVPQKIDVAFTHFREHVLPTLLAKEAAKSDKGAGEANKEDVPSSSTDKGDSCVTSSTEGSTADLISGQQNIPEGEHKAPSSFASLLAAAANDLAAINSTEADCSAITATGKNVLADAPVGAKPPAMILADENAMFPDTSPFSPPEVVGTPLSSEGTPKHTVIKPPTSSSSSSSSSSVVASSTLTVPPLVISLPPVAGKKRSSKTSKKNSSNQEACDNAASSSAAASDNSSSPHKADACSAESTEESEREIARLTDLAQDGFTLRNSNNVTLLHISLMLGRASLIRLEYEWRPKKNKKLPTNPLLDQALSQMSNLLRRLCNIAALDLAEFSKKNDQSKTKGPCSVCGCGGGQRCKKSCAGERREPVSRDACTNTEPLKLYQSPVASPVQMFRRPVLATPRTFVAAPTPVPVPRVQVNGKDPVFRVPLVPSFKQGPTKEEQQRAAKLIQMEPKNKLLRKRTLTPKNRKAPPIIVQRTLLPKVSPNQMVAYIQPGTSIPGQVMVEVNPENLSPVTNIVGSPTTSGVMAKDPLVDRSNDVVLLGPAQLPNQVLDGGKDMPAPPGTQHTINTAPITGFLPLASVAMSGSLDSVCSTNPLELSAATSNAREVPAVSGVVTPVSHMVQISDMSLMSQNDISISDLDISMNCSNMGPDAGDKFLDMVMQNSEQGFSGLIEKQGDKSDSLRVGPGPHLQTTGAATTGHSFDPSVLRTPPHHGISAADIQSHTSMFSSPLKLNISDQAWLNTDTGDVSLSAILDENSSFGKKASGKSGESLSGPPSYTAFFDSSSSDALDASAVSFSKTTQGCDVSLSSFLDANFCKKDDPCAISPLTKVSSSGSGHKLPSSGGLFSSSAGSYSGVQLFSDASQDSIVKLDVDGALQGMVNDSSMDLVSKFESLAAQINARQEPDVVMTGGHIDSSLGLRVGVAHDEPVTLVGASGRNSGQGDSFHGSGTVHMTAGQHGSSLPTGITVQHESDALRVTGGQHDESLVTGISVQSVPDNFRMTNSQQDSSFVPEISVQQDCVAYGLDGSQLHPSLGHGITVQHDSNALGMTSGQHDSTLVSGIASRYESNPMGSASGQNIVGLDGQSRTSEGSSQVQEDGMFHAVTVGEPASSGIGDLVTQAGGVNTVLSPSGGTSVNPGLVVKSEECAGTVCSVEDGGSEVVVLKIEHLDEDSVVLNMMPQEQMDGSGKTTSLGAECSDSERTVLVTGGCEGRSDTTVASVLGNVVGELGSAGAGAGEGDSSEVTSRDSELLNIGGIGPEEQEAAVESIFNLGS
ncbi:protein cramped-like [Aplysia californica]|uniref:Protein cramped-like n=1 Tax=Aplysia californica TaxID=6500 RepID=A0ABM0JX31_APLCA|nr:protein cramped-like [Aplysia californica]